ncbi:MAG: 50S ribosomal protein L35, partial [Planctomycetota bacterium]
MPKQKTHKGTKKRFRLSAKGKAMHRQSGTS